MIRYSDVDEMINRAYYLLGKNDLLKDGLKSDSSKISRYYENQKYLNEKIEYYKSKRDY